MRIQHTADVYTSKRSSDQLEIVCPACGLHVTTRPDGQPITKANYDWARLCATAHSRTGTTRF